VADDGRQPFQAEDRMGIRVTPELGQFREQLQDCFLAQIIGVSLLGATARRPMELVADHAPDDGFRLVCDKPRDQS
jgi:hypothetical protein